jgi:uncharacterized iron-regulated membrane protein
MARHLALLFHRYAGLYIGCYLSVIGFAGSLVVYFDEIDRVLTPELHRVRGSGEPLDPSALISRAEKIEPKARVTDISLKRSVEDATLIRMEPSVDPKTDRPYRIDFTELYLDPVTGEERGRRSFGDLSQGLKGIMPLIYKFHYSLALGDFGVKLLGITALIWVFDCFVGFYLTLPPIRSGSQGRARRGWISRWGLAWSIKFGSLIRGLFDIHRATGLWIWILLLMFAVSSVSFNLRDEVYEPVMRSFAPVESDGHADAAIDIRTTEAPSLDWSSAIRRGRELMLSISKKHAFAIGSEAWIFLDRSRGVYLYTVHSNLDISRSEARTSATFSANDGSLLAVDLPTSHHAGNTITNWLAALHKGKAFGEAYRALLCVGGLLISTLSLTGIYIWQKKRMARILHAQRNSSRRAQYVETGGSLSIEEITNGR